MKKVAVGSKNPTKLEAVRLAFGEIWPEEEWEIIGVSSPSGVSNQPMSDEESITGARNRARHAIAETKADYGVGLEGGIQQIGANHFECGWMVVTDKNGTEGIGSSIKMNTPKKVMELIEKGKELGDVIDILFNRTNAKQAEGYFGLMTKNAITRTKGYTDGVIVALTRFIHPHLFE